MSFISRLNNNECVKLGEKNTCTIRVCFIGWQFFQKSDPRISCEMTFQFCAVYIAMFTFFTSNLETLSNTTWLHNNQEFTPRKMVPSRLLQQKKRKREKTVCGQHMLIRCQVSTDNRKSGNYILDHIKFYNPLETKNSDFYAMASTTCLLNLKCKK